MTPPRVAPALALLGAAALVVLSGCLTVPLAPEKAEDAQFAPARPSSVAVEVTPLRMGHREIPRCAAAGEATCFAEGDIVYVAYLVKHPKATFLIDAGFSTHGRDDLARFGWMQRLSLDWVPEGTLASDLIAHGHPAIDFVLLTHAHWDHTSGLVDLPHPQVFVGPGEADFVRTFPKDEPPAVMPDHLENATVKTVAWDGGAYENFPASHDVFGDGSVVLVPLPGHTPGSMGVFLNDVHGRRLFFVGDAAWSRTAIDLPSHKAKPLSKLVDRDPDALAQTLWRLHELHRHEPDLVMVPAHDDAAEREIEAIVSGK